MINYQVIKKKNPTTKAIKYYAQAKSSSPVTLTQIAENISRECTVHLADIKAVLAALEEQIISALLNGNTVRLGDLGSFRVTLNGKGSDTLEDYTTDLIRSIKVRFLSSTTIRSSFMLSNEKVKFNNLNSTKTSTSSDTAGQ